MSQEITADPAAQEKLKKLHFEDGPRMLIAGRRETCDARNDPRMPKMWEGLTPQIEKIPGRIGKETWAVCFKEAEDSEEFDYLCGVTVSEKHRVKADWDWVELGAQRYASLTHCGDLSKLSETADLILRVWLPSSHYTSARADAASPSYLERYSENYDRETGEGRVEIWVPIKPRESKYTRTIKSQPYRTGSPNSI